MPSYTRTLLRRTLQLLEKLYRERDLSGGQIQRIAVKPQWNAIIGTGGRCGLALNFTGIHDLYEDSRWVEETLRPLVGRDLFQVAREGLDSPGMADACLGIAALSALSQPFLSPASLAERGIHSGGDIEVLADIVREDDRVCVVGYGGIIRPLLGKVQELRVTEMRPKEAFQTLIVGEETEYGPQAVAVHPEEDNRAVLTSSDVNIITASSLINDTFDELLRSSAGARLIGVYGPSVTFVPDVLLEEGIDFVFSFWIRDTERFAFDAVNDVDLEVALKRNQHQHILSRTNPPELRVKPRKSP